MEEIIKQKADEVKEKMEQITSLYGIPYDPENPDMAILAAFSVGFDAAAGMHRRESAFWDKAK